MNDLPARISIRMRWALALGGAAFVPTLAPLSRALRQLPRPLSGQWGLALAATALVCAFFLQPRWMILALSAASAVYLVSSGVGAALLPAALHLALLLVGAVAAGQRGTRRTPTSIAERWFAVGFLYLLAGFGLSFVLLALRGHTRAGLLCGSGLWCAAMVWLEPSALARARDDLLRGVRQPGPAARGLLACTAAAFACSGLLLFLTLFGDAQKAYLAVAKYFALSNRLVLGDPVQLFDGQVRGFANTEEVLLSAGYVLAGDLGARLFAWSIVAVQLAGILALCRRVGRLSLPWAAFATLAFALCPIVVELHAAVRPENLLVVATVAMLVFADRAEASDPSALPLFASAAGIAIGAKYTGLVLVAAACLAFAPTLIRALRGAGVATIAGCVFALLPGAFWYARNLLLFDAAVSVTPYGIHHLTVFFPPIRTARDALDFLGRGFVETHSYTEYGDLGYGLWGAFFLPALIAAFGAAARLRRLAIVAGAYLLVMLSATRQIRYLAPVLPIILLFLTCGLRVLWRGPGQAVRRWALPLAFAAAAAQIGGAFAVNWRRDVGDALRAFAAGRQRPGSTVEPFRTLNTWLRPDDIVMAPFADFNYTAAARIFRGDNFDSFAELLLRQRVYQPAYWLDFDNLAGTRGATYFNDPAFLAAVTEPVVAAGMFWNPSVLAHLRRPSPAALERVRDAIVRGGWDLSAAQVASAGLKRLQPLDTVLGDPLPLPGPGRRLYRLESDGLDAYLGTGERFSVLARHLERPRILPPGRLHSPVLEAQDPVVAVEREGLGWEEKESSWRAERDGARFSYDIQRTWPDDGALVEVYLEGRVAANDSVVTTLGEDRAQTSFVVMHDCSGWCFAGAQRMGRHTRVTLRLNAGATRVRNVCLLFRRSSAPDPGATWLPAAVRLQQQLEPQGTPGLPAIPDGAAYLYDSASVRGLETDGRTTYAVTTEASRFAKVGGHWSRLPDQPRIEGRIHYTMRPSAQARAHPLVAHLFLRGRVYDRDDSMTVVLQAGAKRFEVHAPVFDNLSSPLRRFGPFDLTGTAEVLRLDVTMVGRPFADRVMLTDLLLVLVPKE